MTTRYVEVPANDLREFLLKCGFSRLAKNREEIYQRPHHKDNRYVVRVYSSISNDASVARGNGEDAIRVVALFFRDAESMKKDRATPLYKAKRVHRTGSVEAVLQRMHERMREAYRRINDSLAEGVVPDGPTVKQLNYLKALMSRAGEMIVHGELVKLDRFEVSQRIDRLKEREGAG